MRRYVPVLLWLLVLLLAACREDEGLVGNPIPSEVTLVAPTQATITPGCQASELEAWIEMVYSNVQLFRDESFGYSTMTADAVAPAINRLSDLRDQVSRAAAPECVGELHGIIQTFMDGMIDVFLLYSSQQIDQTTLIAQVTSEQARYDAEIKPKLDEALQTLNTLQSGEQ